MKKFSLLLFCVTCLWAITKVSAQAPVPELLHYTFNGSGTNVPNLASNPPAGTANATLLGGLTQGGVGQCGGGVIGTGVSSTTDYVNTGWATNLPGSFTISFWTSNISGTSTLYYIFGDAGAGGFRCFTNGVAGANNWILRGTGITDVTVNGAATVAPSLTTFVYDQSANTIKGYFNGILTTTVAQGATPTINGTGPFKVVGYSSNVGSPANGILDEFRVYSRALSDAEVQSLYTVTDYDTVAVSACSSYTSPSGLYTYTTSGSYNDTLSNSSGCDSILTINLTITSPSSSSFVAVACDSYVSPSGNHIWTTSGVYTDTLVNSIGCDSVITIGLVINQSTTSTINVSTCNSYTTPSGLNTYTASGTYTDVITNSAGCDSTITINLTINNSTAASISETVCNSYTSPSGVVYTTSGLYNDTIPNSAGCDSIITITLIVNNSTASSITETACDSYTSPSGNVWATSGTYFDTIPNQAGCDSIITINLTLFTSTASTINPVACNTYTSPAGNVLTASGTYTETIPNNAGCDSVITINLTIAAPTASSISATSCGSYTTPSGNVVSTSGTFNDTIANSNGCDSVITITLTINTPTASAINATACDTYESPSGLTWVTSGIYTDTIPNSNGCDSIITITLVINSTNAAVTQAGPVLTANAAGGTYLWFDCQSSTAIIGANGQAYTATANGSYAVVVVNANGCTDTSACLTVTGIGIPEVGSLAGNLNMFPNPTSGIVTIVSTLELNNAVVKVFNYTGQIVMQQNIADGRLFTFDASELAVGIYVVDITAGDNFARLKLVKN